LFQGAHAYHIDEKGRLKMPADFAQELGPSFTITRATQDCLWAMPPAAWATIIERLKGSTMMDESLLELQRWFVGSAHTLSLDGQGRFTIPQQLREFAGIQHELMMVGMIDRIEIWSRERWNAGPGAVRNDTIKHLASQAHL